MNKQISDFFGYLFYVRDVAHLTHLYQPDKSLATHLALGDYYEGIIDLIDELIECYQGMYELTYFTIPTSAPTNTPISFLKEVCDYVESNRAIFNSTSLQNIIDEICAITSRTLYKLKYVK